MAYFETYEDIQRRAFWLGRRAGHAPASTEDVEDLINAAFLRVYTELASWDFAKTTADITAVSSVVVLPEDCSHVWKVTAVDDNSTEYIELDPHADFEKAAGGREAYYIWGADTATRGLQMHLINADADQEVKVYYHKRPPTINSSVTSAELPPDEIIDLCCYAVAVDLASFNEDRTVYQMFESNYERKKGKLETQQYKRVNRQMYAGGYEDTSFDSDFQEISY